MLKPIIKVWRSNLVRQESIRFRFDLIHSDPKHASASLVGAAAGCFHNSEIAAGADHITSFSQ